LKEGTVALGVDYGTVRIGTATMAGWAPRRLGAIDHPGNDLIAARQLALAARGQGASVVVVGLPLNKDGAETYQAKLTRTFAVLLASVIEQAYRSAKLAAPPVVLVDERYSSKQGERSSVA
jgi:RNase H-fold protein (predicted Holliday junction resolvase)